MMRPGGSNGHRGAARSGREAGGAAPTHDRPLGFSSELFL